MSKLNKFVNKPFHGLFLQDWDHGEEQVVPVLLRTGAPLAAVCTPGLTMASCQCPPSCSPLPLHSRAENRVEKHMGDSREVTYPLPSGAKQENPFIAY